MRATYLTGERVYLRGMIEDDRSYAISWYDTVFPVNSTAAEEYLNEQHQSVWDVAERSLAIARTADDAVVGGASLRFAGNRKTEIRLHMAPAIEDSDALQAESLRMLVPWLLHEHNMRRVHIGLAADEEVTIAVARDLGMVEGVRLREFFYKHGQRVDMLIFQILNPAEEHRYA